MEKKETSYGETEATGHMTLLSFLGIAVRTSGGQRLIIAPTETLQRSLSASTKMPCEY